MPELSVPGAQDQGGFTIPQLAATDRAVKLDILCGRRPPRIWLSLTTLGLTRVVEAGLGRVLIFVLTPEINSLGLAHCTSGLG